MCKVKETLNDFLYKMQYLVIYHLERKILNRSMKNNGRADDLKLTGTEATEHRFSKMECDTLSYKTDKT